MSADMAKTQRAKAISARHPNTADDRTPGNLTLRAPCPHHANRVVRIAGADGGEFRLNQPHGVKVDKNGALYIADSLNNRVLKTTAE